MIVSPVIVFSSPKPAHLTSLSPRILSLYLLISFMTNAVFPIVYLVLTFQHPMFKWSLGVRRDLLRGLVVLLASLRLSPGAVIVASTQWRKLSSGMSQFALVRSRIAFVSVASWYFMGEGCWSSAHPDFTDQETAGLLLSGLSLKTSLT